MNIIIGLVFWLMLSGSALAQAPAPDTLKPADAEMQAKAVCGKDMNFNKCVAATVSYIYADRRNLGYADHAFTRALDYGPASKVIRSDKPPVTMCVAAISEVVIEALNIYYKSTGDAQPFDVIKVESWNSSRPVDIRSYIWENEGPSNKRGAGTAFATFGIGEVVRFQDAQPGDFISLDRSKFRPRVGWTKAETEKFSKKKLVKFEGQDGVWQSSGHSTIFLEYLSKSLKPTLKYSQGDIVGFMYFSSQGGLAPNGGFGYRWAIFKDTRSSAGIDICGVKTLNARIDCALDGIDRGSLRVGRLKHPKSWNARSPITCPRAFRRG